MGNVNKKKSYTIEDIKKLNKKDFTPKEKFILLLGETGNGKSTFVNQITGKNECLEGDDPEAITTEPNAVPLDYKGCNFYFIDTPGLNDKKGDITNIQKIENLRDLPRITTFIIVLKFNDLRITESIQKSLIQFMKTFPSKDFWNNVIVVRNWSFDDSRKGKLLEGIKKDSKLMECINCNKISIPNIIKEFYIDLKSKDGKKHVLFQQILTIIKEMNPVYKDVKIDDTYHFENEGEFVKLIRIRLTEYIDFDNESHSFKERFEEGVYNIKKRRPSLITVKREVGPCRNKFMCWCKQYEIKYVCYKIYEIQGQKYTKTFVKDKAWEDEGNEENGENYRRQLEDEENELNKKL